MSTLIRRYSDPLHIFLYRSLYDLKSGAIVPEMDDLSATALHDASHDIDRGVMPIKKRSCCKYPDFIFSLVGGSFLHKMSIFPKQNYERKAMAAYRIPN